MLTTHTLVLRLGEGCSMRCLHALLFFPWKASRPHCNTCFAVRKRRSGRAWSAAVGKLIAHWNEME